MSIFTEKVFFYFIFRYGIDIYKWPVPSLLYHILPFYDSHNNAPRYKTIAPLVAIDAPRANSHTDIQTYILTYRRTEKKVEKT